MFSSGHGGQYNEEEENSALLIKFKNTMRDGGWKKESKSNTGSFYRPSQLKAEGELYQTQSSLSRKLS